jgi:hypothetical protein
MNRFNHLAVTVTLAAVLCSLASVRAQQSKVIWRHNNTTVVDFGSRIAPNRDATAKKYIVQRSTGRFSPYTTIGETAETRFSDKTATGSPYDYYYRILDSEGVVLTTLSMNEETFGPNMYFYSPTDDMAQITTEINTIGSLMEHAHYDAKRYSLNFKPGKYSDCGSFNVGFYTSVNGLGDTPDKVELNNIKTPPHLTNNNATQTFWRSIENFKVIDKGDGNLVWGVSQAAPIRRVHSERSAQYDWNGGWASGGFTSDCYFEKSMGSYSQQQWYTRNSHLEKGSSGFTKGNWNTCYQGVTFGASVYLNDHSDNWQGTSGGNNISRVELTPVVREKPFLFIDSDGKYKVFRPGLHYDSKGVTWTTSNRGWGTVHDLETEFYVVKPGATAAEMNASLAAGKHLFITPGIYEMSEPLHITKANTIVLGTGYATLVPSSTNTETLILIDDVEGVTVASLLFECRYSTKSLMQAGPEGASGVHCANPTLLSDLFFRVGGYYSQAVHTDVALVINSSDVIGDHFWIWRADHGSGVGWTTNTSPNGLIVNGDFVTIYGLFNEHFNDNGTVWNGEKGRTYFYQNEAPYDPPAGEYTWVQYKVSDHVKWHEANMLGMYSVFKQNVFAKNSMEVPNSKGVRVHHICNVDLGNGGFRYILNGQVASTANGTFRVHIVDYTGTEDPGAEPERCQGRIVEVENSGNSLKVFPNPAGASLNIEGEVSSAVFYTLLGKEVLSSKESTIDVSALTRGVYLLKVTDKKGIEKTVRLQIQ